MNIKINPRRVRELRYEKQLSLQDIASQIGVSMQAVSNWESDKFQGRSRDYVQIRANNLQKLAKALSCTEDYLCNLSDHKFKNADDIRMMGMPLGIVTDIHARVDAYSPTQQKFLQDFLDIFDLLSPGQLDLLKRIFAAIEKIDLPPISVRYPLTDYDQFKRMFVLTLTTLDKIANELTRNLKNPDELEMLNEQLALCKTAFTTDFQELSRPLLHLQNKENFNASLLHIHSSFKDLDNFITHHKLSKLSPGHYSQYLEHALEKDISSFWGSLKTATIT